MCEANAYPLADAQVQIPHIVLVNGLPAGVFFQERLEDFVLGLTRFVRRVKDI